ncbi:hypothetical protein [Escherichia coli]|uniref:hypothetical protein n=1 Tax=Escherichia coli TaxID=562 RepID=UPI0020202A01|nr:hypothetical protein [Escherichia coli]
MPNKTADELLVFSRYLRKQTAEIESVRQLLLSQMREEFIELTSFEPVTMFSLFKSIKKNVMQFFCISALKIDALLQATPVLNWGYSC